MRTSAISTLYLPRWSAPRAAAYNYRGVVSSLPWPLAPCTPFAWLRRKALAARLGAAQAGASGALIAWHLRRRAAYAFALQVRPRDDIALRGTSRCQVLSPDESTHAMILFGCVPAQPIDLRSRTLQQVTCHLSDACVSTMHECKNVDVRTTSQIRSCTCKSASSLRYLVSFFNSIHPQIKPYTLR